MSENTAQVNCLQNDIKNGNKQNVYSIEMKGGENKINTSKNYTFAWNERVNRHQNGILSLFLFRFFLTVWITWMDTQFMQMNVWWMPWLYDWTISILMLNKWIRFRNIHYMRVVRYQAYNILFIYSTWISKCFWYFYHFWYIVNFVIRFPRYKSMNDECIILIKLGSIS